MDVGRLDRQDEKTMGATKRAEERIVRGWLVTALVVFVLGISAGTITACAINSQLNLWLGVFVVAIVGLLVFIACQLIVTAIYDTKAEFRKLEGFISISTLTLVEEIEKK